MPRPQSAETVSRRMATVRSTDTGPERAVRSMTHALGARFRLANRGLPGSPDLANRSRRWAIFVHGCFWHAHLGCPKAMSPKSNKVYWRRKLRMNRARDRTVVGALRARGFRVLVIWQCELRAPGRVVRRLRPFLSLD
ncbi:MAG: DNA mismatch endonuclease Vsr [Deltaproteobacteria bacterium]|nr:DNA mismatch endonuclease Vsr [Deltaproteobacteria bacterium]MBI3389655.1 DNA mismatch endonuclease Vsr [Deltaproteobacteria bacterium]